MQTKKGVGNWHSEERSYKTDLSLSSNIVLMTLYSTVAMLRNCHFQLSVGRSLLRNRWKNHMW